MLKSSSTKSNNLISDFFFQDFKYIVKLSIKLRWGVIILLLLLPLVLQKMNLFCNARFIYMTIFFIVAYNSFYTLIVGKQEIALKNNQFLKICNYMGLMQFLFDYISITMILYFTGTLYTSLFYVFILHIVVGTLFLESILVFSMISCYLFVYFLLSLLQLNAVIPYCNLFNLENNLTLSMIYFETIVHGVILFSTFYILLFLVKKIKDDTIRIDNSKTELENNLKKISDLELRKSKFMRFAAHQLRSPVATVIAALNVLCKKMIPLQEDRAFKLLVGAHDKAGALLLIINDLLELSRIREAKKKLMFSKKVNLIEVIEKIIYSLNSKIQSANLLIERVYICYDAKLESTDIFADDNSYQKFIETTPFLVCTKGDESELYSALYNIIENSVKYSNDGKAIKIKLNCDNKKVVLNISDQGIGIDPEYIEDIFMEFVRSPNAKTSINEGTGLGLSITKEILDIHNATIKVTSELDCGSEFEIEFDQVSN